MILPALRPDSRLAAALHRTAQEQDSLSAFAASKVVAYASWHYAVETSVSPETAALDAAEFVACHANDNILRWAR